MGTLELELREIKELLRDVRDILLHREAEVLERMEQRKKTPLTSKLPETQPVEYI